jgi:hypothetical protein
MNNAQKYKSCTNVPSSQILDLINIGSRKITGRLIDAWNGIRRMELRSRCIGHEGKRMMELIVIS